MYYIRQEFFDILEFSSARTLYSLSRYHTFCRLYLITLKRRKWQIKAYGGSFHPRIFM